MKSKLILGTVQFGLNYGINNTVGKPSTRSIEKILDTAFNNGISLLDSAEAYGDSHERIGEYHQNSDNKFKVISKYSSKVKNLPSSIIERVKANIEILNVDDLYSYMFHSYSDFVDYFSLFRDDLLYLKSKGLIKKIGVSLYSNEEFEEVLKFDEIELIQLPFNLLDNDNNRGEILKKGKDKGVEIHTRSAFLQGLFFKNVNQLSTTLKPLKYYLNTLQSLCDKNHKMNDLALNYACNKSYIDKVLIGVDNVNHLESNLLSEKIIIRNELINEIEAINVKETELLNPSNW